MIILTIFGASALTVVLIAYILEKRSTWWIFALVCGSSFLYGWLDGTWPFGIVEGIWALVALRRWWLAYTHSAQVPATQY